MSKFVYIHGFNGGCGGDTTGLLSTALNTRVFCLSYDYSRPFEECLSTLEEKALAVAQGESLHVTGMSLGGFYATQLRRVPIASVTVWNPVIFPAIQLAQFLGENSLFVDDKTWTFTEDLLYSYAHAADPRDWKNFYWHKSEGCQSIQPPRSIIIGRSDDLLDARLAESYWQNHASVYWIEAGHGVGNFDHLKTYAAWVNSC